MTVYYNEIDPYAAQWLRNLIDAGHIARGVVDERSIVDIRPSDLDGFTQCHFFAGIGGWSLALRLAGWSDDRPVWTGSCPCQPFSAAGKGLGTADERHLWPAFFHLIGECRPPVVFGEQVASKDALGWWDAVHADLEDADYACGAVDLCAAGVGAPHIRQRLYWVADAECRASERWGHDVGGAPHRSQGEARQRQRVRPDVGAGDIAGLVADSIGARLEGRDARAMGHKRPPAERSRGAGELGDTGCSGPPEQRGRWIESARPAASGFWRDADWIDCRDGKRRPVEPSTFPLASRHPSGLGLLRAGQEPDAPIPREDQGSRIGRLRAYGNAIVPQVAAEMIAAYMDSR